MFCPECGEDNPDDSLYCMKCGTDLSRAREQYQERYGEQPRRDQSQSTGYDNTQPRYERPTQPQGYSAKPAYTPYVERYGMSPPPGTFAYICSFCFPPAALVFYFMHRSEHPEPARNLLILGIVMFFIYLTLNMV